MVIRVKRTIQDEITIPAKLMDQLNLQDDEEVQVVVEGETLRLARLAGFLELRGALADDASFDRAIDWLDSAWKTWPHPPSASTPTS